MKSSTSMEPAATVESPAKTGSPAHGEAANLSTMPKVAKGSGTYPTLAARAGKSPGSTAVSVEGSRPCAEHSAATEAVPAIESPTTRGATSCKTPVTPTPTVVKGIAVVEGIASGEVPGPTEGRPMIVPITSPVVPTPSETSEEANPEAYVKRKERTAEPDTGIRIPPRPRIQRRPINRPRIVRRNIDDIGVGRFNFDVGAAIGDHILRRKSADCRLAGRGDASPGPRP